MQIDQKNFQLISVPVKIISMNLFDLIFLLMFTYCFVHTLF